MVEEIKLPLKMKIADTILITGANRGIGLELVRQISAKFSPRMIFATCRNLNDAQDLQKLAAERPLIKIVNLKDVRDYGAYDGILAELNKMIGSCGLNLLINNAGVSPMGQSLSETSSHQLLETYEINAVAPLLLTRTLVPLIEKAAQKNCALPVSVARAAVINISSTMGSIAEVEIGGFYPYRCSKASLNMITKCLSIDLQPKNILVTSIHPGWVRTQMGGPRASMTVDECVCKLLATLPNLNQSHNGTFVNYASKPVPW